MEANPPRGIFIVFMAERPPAQGATRFLEALAAQLENDRRAFLLGNAIYVGANLVLAGLVWSGAGRLPGWLPAGVAFLGSVFYALTAEWELRWRAVWRRELPRLESEAGFDVLSRVAGTGAGLGRGLRLLCWGISVLWLLLLMLAIGETGWMPRLA